MTVARAAPRHRRSRVRESATDARHPLATPLPRVRDLATEDVRVRSSTSTSMSMSISHAISHAMGMKHKVRTRATDAFARDAPPSRARSSMESPHGTFNQKASMGTNDIERPSSSPFDVIIPDEGRRAIERRRMVARARGIELNSMKCI